jgi:hypothetical protein
VERLPLTFFFFLVVISLVISGFKDKIFKTKKRKKN